MKLEIAHVPGSIPGVRMAACFVPANAFFAKSFLGLGLLFDVMPFLQNLFWV